MKKEYKDYIMQDLVMYMEAYGFAKKRGKYHYIKVVDQETALCVFVDLGKYSPDFSFAIAPVYMAADPYYAQRKRADYSFFEQRNIFNVGTYGSIDPFMAAMDWNMVYGNRIELKCELVRAEILRGIQSVIMPSFVRVHNLKSAIEELKKLRYLYQLMKCESRIWNDDFFPILSYHNVCFYAYFDIMDKLDAEYAIYKSETLKSLEHFREDGNMEAYDECYARTIGAVENEIKRYKSMSREEIHQEYLSRCEEGRANLCDCFGLKEFKTPEPVIFSKRENANEFGIYPQPLNRLDLEGIYQMGANYFGVYDPIGYK